MRKTPYNFIAGEKAAQPVAEPAKENTAPTEPTKEPAKPEPGFFEKYKTVLIILAIAAIALFVWKFKIVSRTAQAVVAVA